jgi:N6-L-threonylcarbamoyladenine synthase
VKILGIDSSCDDTAAAVVVDGLTVLSNITASQHGSHVRYGGIVPSVASRKHSELINAIIERALGDADIAYGELDAVAVTADQGLAPALAVGVAAAKSIAMALEIPLVGVHHVEGHIYSNVMAFPDRLTYPFLCVTVAGGHTMILKVIDVFTYDLVGSCRDDSAGEAYDKIARRMGLGYPGGPIIDKLARIGSPTAFQFPRPMLEKGNFDFSFSGLKTAVNRVILDLETREITLPVEDIAASFQEAVIDVVVGKAVAAAEDSGLRNIALAGGVAANDRLRAKLSQAADTRGLSVFIPPLSLCTDNGAMIAGFAYQAYLAGRRSDLQLDYRPNAPLGQRQVKYRAKTKYEERGR